jgi:hypothetical protein
MSDRTPEQLIDDVFKPEEEAENQGPNFADRTTSAKLGADALGFHELQGLIQKHTITRKAEQEHKDSAPKLIANLGDPKTYPKTEHRI